MKFPWVTFANALVSIMCLVGIAGYVGAVVVPKITADNSPPYVGLRHEPIKSSIVAGEKFCYYAIAKNRRDCASVTGQHIFRNGSIEFREAWEGTAKPGPMPKMKPWCATTPPRTGTYEYFWTGRFVGCKNASHDLSFRSPSLPVTVIEPTWGQPEVIKE